MVGWWIRAALSLAPLCCAGSVPQPIPWQQAGVAGKGTRQESVPADVVWYRLHKPYLLGHCIQPGFHQYFLRLALSAVAWAHLC